MTKEEQKKYDNKQTLVDFYIRDKRRDAFKESWRESYRSRSN